MLQNPNGAFKIAYIIRPTVPQLMWSVLEGDLQNITNPRLQLLLHTRKPWCWACPEQASGNKPARVSNRNMWIRENLSELNGTWMTKQESYLKVCRRESDEREKKEKRRQASTTTHINFSLVWRVSNENRVTISLFRWTHKRVIHSLNQSTSNVWLFATHLTTRPFTIEFCIQWLCFCLQQF